MTAVENAHGHFEIRRSNVDGGRGDGLLHCSYCGSITLAAFLQGIKEGARPEIADMKYGYLHKIYLANMPVQEHWGSSSSTEQITKRNEAGTPVEKVRTVTMRLIRTDQVKFYTEHVKDGSEEDQKAYWTWLNGYVAARMSAPL